MNNFTNFLSHLNSFGSHSRTLNEQDGPIEPPLRTGIDKYKYGDGGLVQYDQYRTPKEPTATPSDDSYDQDGPIEPPRTEEPEPFVGPPSPQSNKPSLSPSPRSQRDNRGPLPNHHGMPASPGDWTGPVSRPTPRPPRDSMGRLLETNNFNNFLNHLNLFSKKFVK